MTDFDVYFLYLSGWFLVFCVGAFIVSVILARGDRRRRVVSSARVERSERVNARIIKIERCLSCPNYHFSGRHPNTDEGHSCLHLGSNNRLTHLNVSVYGRIPDWCPLPKADVAKPSPAKMVDLGRVAEDELFANGECPDKATPSKCWILYCSEVGKCIGARGCGKDTQ